MVGLCLFVSTAEHIKHWTNTRKKIQFGTHNPSSNLNFLPRLSHNSAVPKLAWGNPVTYTDLQLQRSISQIAILNYRVP